MQKIISAAEMRALDALTIERCGIPSLLLMEQAATCALRVIADSFGGMLRGAQVRVFCGTGANGGDGAALARLLLLEGADLQIFLIGCIEDTQGDTRTNFEIIRRLAATEANTAMEMNDANNRNSAIEFSECIDEAAWKMIERKIDAASFRSNIIVDALFGTGLSRPAAGVHELVINYINRVRQQRSDAAHTPRIVSLDLPSGCAADSGVVHGAAVEADVTVTFTAPKIANVMPPAARYTGQLIIRSVGTPHKLARAAASQTYVAEADDAQTWLRRTRYVAGSYKNNHGHALIIGGSRDMSGAPALAANAAFCAGAGLVTLAAPASAHLAATLHTRPEVMVAALAENTEHGGASLESLERARTFARRATIVALGPGLSSASDETRNFVREFVAHRTTPVVIDADGLNALAPWSPDVRGTQELPLILTPHEGEMRRLLGISAASDTPNNAADPLADRIAAARDFATTHNLFLVLKGERTIVAAPDGRVCINPTGNPGLGTAGAGDTLTGIIAAFLAQEYAACPAAEADAFHALIAALYVGGMAGDLAATKHGMRAMVASNISEALGAVFTLLDPAGESPFVSS